MLIKSVTKRIRNINVVGSWKFEDFISIMWLCSDQCLVNLLNRTSFECDKLFFFLFDSLDRNFWCAFILMRIAKCEATKDWNSIKIIIIWFSIIFLQLIVWQSVQCSKCRAPNNLLNTNFQIKVFFLSANASRERTKFNLKSSWA